MVYIVSELGVNFSSIEMAKEMISASKRCGADAVKFQVYNHDNLYKVYPLGEVKRHPQYKELMKIMLGLDELKELINHADNIGINMFATPMYLEAVNLLEEIGVDRYKIRYADRYNIPLLKKVIETNKYVMVSCDSCYLSSKPDIDHIGYINVGLMHCQPEYPPEKISMPKQFEEWNFVGYSNHFPSIAPPIIATSKSARIIEVHVKFKDTTPPDNAVSITFEQLEMMIGIIREVELYING